MLKYVLEYHETISWKVLNRASPLQPFVDKNSLPSRSNTRVVKGTL